MSNLKVAKSPETQLAPGTFRLTRRDLVKATGVGVSGCMLASVAGAAASQATPSSSPPYPELRIAQVNELKVDAPVQFNYPDDSSPAILIRLSQGGAPGGVGPNNSIVGFSQLCTHKGCPVQYKAERKLLICPCHWSSFDPTKSGQMVIGQASQALPQIRLRVTGNSIFALGVDGLIFGRHTNML